MRAVDTNIIVRFLTGDDEGQAAHAARLFQEPVFFPITVILESAWVLSSRYKLAREAIADNLTDLLDLPTSHIDNEERVRQALDRYRAGADLADMLHLVAATTADRFATFDKQIARFAADGPLPIELLGD